MVSHIDSLFPSCEIVYDIEVGFFFIIITQHKQNYFLYIYNYIGIYYTKQKCT